MYIFGHDLIVNSRCYGRCYVKKNNLNYCVLSLVSFHTHLEANSAGSSQNVFEGLKSCVFKKLNFS